MPHRDAPAICRKIDAALNYLGEDDELRPYLIHQMEQIFDGPRHIGLDDCATSELMALLAVLVPIFNRRLVGAGVASPLPVDAKLLRLVRGSGDMSTGT